MGAHKTRDIEKSLLRKGFAKVNTHHEMFWLMDGDKKTGVRTRVSHGKEEYGDNLLGQMAKQVKLNRRQLDDFIECPLDKDEYLSIVRSKGI